MDSDSALVEPVDSRVLNGQTRRDHFYTRRGTSNEIVVLTLEQDFATDFLHSFSEHARDRFFAVAVDRDLRCEYARGFVVFEPVESGYVLRRVA